MIGMDAATGKPLSGLDHLRQRVRDILTTPIGTRVCNRDYGSLLPELVDQPMNGAGRLRLIAATALAVARWEPALRLTRVNLASPAAGQVELTLEGYDAGSSPATARTLFTVPLRSSGSLTAFA